MCCVPLGLPVSLWGSLPPRRRGITSYLVSEMKPLTLATSLTLGMLLGCIRSSETQPISSTKESATSPPNDDVFSNPLTSNVLHETKDVSKLQEYFERYCDDDDSLGIGFVAWQTYDNKFRQYLKNTNDEELKRLYVLRHLYQDVDFALSDFDEDRIQIGKNMYRKMTDDEKRNAKEQILGMLDDLEEFDPGDPEREINDTRAKLK